MELDLTNSALLAVLLGIVIKNSVDIRLIKKEICPQHKK